MNIMLHLQKAIAIIGAGVVLLGILLFAAIVTCVAMGGMYGFILLVETL